MLLSYRLPPVLAENNAEQNTSDHHAVVKQAVEAGARQTKCSRRQNDRRRAAKQRSRKKKEKQLALATQALQALDDYCALATQRRAAKEEDEQHGSLDYAASRPRRKIQDRRNQRQASVRGERVGNSNVEALAQHLFVGICAGKLGPLRDGAAGRVAVRGR